MGQASRLCGALTGSASGGGARPRAPPARIDVSPGVADDAIAERLRRILVATEWFDEPRVRVRDGVVFLRGAAESEQRKAWSSELARNGSCARASNAWRGVASATCNAPPSARRC
jgi:hypothetical protein